MSIKDLFNKTTFIFDSPASASVGAESSDNVEFVGKDNETYLPTIDFTTASNFIKYGSAELYYSNSIKRIYQQYPYDGSLSEKTLFQISSSVLDRWMYEYKYPKTNGYVLLGENYGSLTAQVGGGSDPTYGGYGNLEYISVLGGMHTASVGMIGKPLSQTFDDSIVFHTASNRTVSLRVDMVTGSTVEFWLRKPNIKSSAEHEVIFDLWNGQLSSSADYGRMTIEYRTDSAAGKRFIATLRSGSNGFTRQQIGAAIPVGNSDWTHYAISFIAEGANIRTRLYTNGEETSNDALAAGAALGELSGAINANIGALLANPHGNTYHHVASQQYQGYGRLSGSLDEFRFWKTRRTSEQIQKNYFHPIGGGQNKKHPDDELRNLGVYYKFNEGITQTNSIDSVVLDYSGRVTNGTWVGYPGASSRNTGSAMVSASVLTAEPLDPIIYSTHPDVVTLSSEMQESGSMHDRLSGSFLYDTLPTWVREEDVKGNAKNLMQIIASYFDTLYSQVTELAHLQDKQYYDIDNENYEVKPSPFIRRALESKGFLVSELFPNSSILELFMDRDDNNIKFEEKVENIKNLIYQNIYNNLEKIYKTKGTHESYRNFLRCFGIDDELVKLNIYTDKGTHYFRDNVRHTSVKKKYVDFNHTDRFSATLYQTTSTLNTKNYISGTISNFSESNSSLTYEADIIVPHKLRRGERGYFSTDFLTASIFGQHTADNSSPTSYTWASPDNSEFKVYLIRDELESTDAYFMLTSSVLGVELTSSTYKNVYDNERWNLAVRIKPEHFPIDGGITNASAPRYDIEFYGVNYALDTVENEFFLSASVSNTLGKNFLSSHKRVYAGAHRTNFEGSILDKTDLQIGPIRVWFDYLNNQTIKQHALDPLNYGAAEGAYSNSTMFTTNLSGTHIPKYDSLILHWEYDTVTGSDGSGFLDVDDFSSGSAPPSTVGELIYGWVDDVIRRENKAKGNFFPVSSTSMLSIEHIFSSRKQLPENSVSYDSVNIKGDEEKFFIQDDDVSDNFYSLEKSMYANISEEMLNTFSTIAEFSNLIGKYQDRYKNRYKRIDHLRKLFFQRVTGDMNFDKFMSYFKWVDSSISMMIKQLIPASARISPEVSNLVESHILERNKYQSKFPLTQRYESTEGRLKGRGELEYNWKFGHAPRILNGTAVLTIADPVTVGDTLTFSDGVAAAKTYEFVTSVTNASVQILRTATALLQKTYIKNRLEADFNVTFGTITSADSVDITNDNELSPRQSAQFGISANFTSANNSISGFTGNENENCLWWNERVERSGSIAMTSKNSNITQAEADDHDEQRQTIRRTVTSEISGSGNNFVSGGYTNVPTKTVYTGSAYALRSFSKPMRMVVSKQEMIHAGINYDVRKDRNIVHNAVHIHGPLDTLYGAPRNVMLVGAGTGTGILPAKDCNDLVNPDLDATGGIFARKVKRSLTIEMGREYQAEYSGTLGDDVALPFNFYSSSARTAGIDKTVASDYANVIVTNLHSDTYNKLNDIGIQGPFTDTWVGGHQHRHVDLNKYDTNLVTYTYDSSLPPHQALTSGSTTNNLDDPSSRAEAWRLLMAAATFTDSEFNAQVDTDGVFGLVGPDYGAFIDENGNILNSDKHRFYAVRYRDERAKRPVNLANIKTIRPQFDSNGSIVQNTSSVYRSRHPYQHSASADSFPNSTHQLMTGSPRQGNFYSNYEVVQAPGRTANNLYLRKAFGSLDIDSQTNPFMPEAIVLSSSFVYRDYDQNYPSNERIGPSVGNGVTHYSALYGRRPSRIHNDGNIFLRNPAPSPHGSLTGPERGTAPLGNSQHAHYCLQFETETGTQGLEIARLLHYTFNPHNNIFNGLDGSHSVGWTSVKMLDRFVYSSWFNISEALSYVPAQGENAANIEEHVLLRLGGGNTPFPFNESEPDSENNTEWFAEVNFVEGQYAFRNANAITVQPSPATKSNISPYTGTDGYEFKVIASTTSTFKFWFGVMLPNGEAAWWCSDDTFSYTEAPSGPPARMQSGWYHTAIEWNPSPDNFQGEFTSTYAPTLYVNGTKYTMTQQTNSIGPLQFAPNESGAYVPPDTDPSYMFVDKNFSGRLPPLDINHNNFLKGFQGFVADAILWYAPRSNTAPYMYYQELNETFAHRLYNRGFLMDPRNISDAGKVFWFTMNRYHLDDHTCGNAGSFSEAIYNVLENGERNPSTQIMGNEYSDIIARNRRAQNCGFFGADRPLLTTLTSHFSQVAPPEGYPRVVDTSGYHWEYAFDKNPSLSGSNSDSVIVTRFSSPGGPEIQSRGFLDAAAGEYSVYNCLTFRNSTVLGNKIRSAPFGCNQRTLPSCNFVYQFQTPAAAIGGSGEFDGSSDPFGFGQFNLNNPPSQYANHDGIRVVDHLGFSSGLKQLLTRHCGKYGTDISMVSYTDITRVMNTGSFGLETPSGNPIRPAFEFSSSNFPAFHKQQRNPSYRPTGMLFRDPCGDGKSDEPILKVNYDNAYVNTPIPRSDYQYSWISDATGRVHLTHPVPTDNCQESNGFFIGKTLYGYAPRSGMVDDNSISQYTNGAYLQIPAQTGPPATMAQFAIQFGSNLNTSLTKAPSNFTDVFSKEFSFAGWVYADSMSTNDEYVLFNLTYDSEIRAMGYPIDSSLKQASLKRGAPNGPTPIYLHLKIPAFQGPDGKTYEYKWFVGGDFQDSWHHVVFTHDGTSHAKCYVDSVELQYSEIFEDGIPIIQQNGTIPSFSGQAKDSDRVDLNYNSYALYGRSTDYQQQLNWLGKVDETAWFAKSLTQQQVDTIYNEGKPFNYANDITTLNVSRWFRFGDQYDFSGQSYQTSDVVGANTFAISTVGNYVVDRANTTVASDFEGLLMNTSRIWIYDNTSGNISPSIIPAGGQGSFHNARARIVTTKPAIDFDLHSDIIGVVASEPI